MNADRFGGPSTNVCDGVDEPTLSEGDTPPSDMALCFSGLNHVQLEDESILYMKDLRVGDMVKVDKNKFEPVYGFGHRDESLKASFLKMILLCHATRAVFPY